MRPPRHRRSPSIPAAVLALAALAAWASTANAQSMAVRLDPQRTEIRWVLRGFPDTVHGTFRLLDGSLRFDPASAVVEGACRVDARSGQSGNVSRDRTMHEEILDSATYPVVSFRPLRLESPYPASGEGEVRIGGILALRGVEHGVTVTVRLSTRGDVVVADTHLTIPYVAWGLKDPSVFIFRAAKRVEVDIHAVGSLDANP
jgi:polyisoprenoid-binding protein YceI